MCRILRDGFLPYYREALHRAFWRKRRRPWLCLGALPGGQAVQRMMRPWTVAQGVVTKTLSKGARLSSVRPPHRRRGRPPSRYTLLFAASPSPRRTTALHILTVPHEDSFRIRAVLYKCPVPSQLISMHPGALPPHAATYHGRTHCFGRHS